MNRTSVCAAVLFLLLALGHCARRAEPEALFADAETLRVKHEKGASERALEKYREAVAIWRSSSAREAAAPPEGMGETYQQLGRLIDAQKAFGEALTFAERASDRLLEADIQGDVGFVLASVGDRAEALAQAEEACQKALNTARTLGDQRAHAKALVCLGEITYSRGGSFEPALELQEEAEAVWRRAGNQAGVAQARLARGRVVYRTCAASMRRVLPSTAPARCGTP